MTTPRSADTNTSADKTKDDKQEATTNSKTVPQIDAQTGATQINTLAFGDKAKYRNSSNGRILTENQYDQSLKKY